MLVPRLKNWMAAAAAIVATLGCWNAAFAQGCTMCYTSAAAAKASAIQALRSGILILLIPPVLMLGAIVVVTYRRRNRFKEENPWSPELAREYQEMLARLDAEHPDLSRKAESEDRSRVL